MRIYRFRYNKFVYVQRIYTFYIIQKRTFSHFDPFPMKKNEFEFYNTMNHFIDQKTKEKKCQVAESKEYILIFIE